MNIYGTHWIPTHRGTLGSTPDRDVFARWQPGMVKIVTVDNTVPYLEDVPPQALIVVRNHPMSELYDNRGTLGDVEADYDDHWANATNQPTYKGPDGMPHPIRLPVDAQKTLDMAGGWQETFSLTPEQIGAQHAATCDTMANYCASKGVGRERLIFEGLNEPQVWTAGESPDKVARYYRAFLESLHDYDLRGCVGNFGVGWPGNGGVQDAPVQWGFFEPVIREFRPGDYLGLHEYWALNGPQENWRWWAGRFTQCPFDVPILITECGIDTGVTGQWYGGWRDLAGNDERIKAMRYVYELQWYAEQCAKDGRVQQVFPFTYDIGSSHWEKFDVRGWAFLDAFFAVQDTWPRVSDGVPPPPPPGLFRDWLWDEAKAHQCISLNVDAALQKRILSDGYIPIGNEWTAEWQGIVLQCQLAGRLDSAIERCYYCIYGEWDAITYEEYRP